MSMSFTVLITGSTHGIGRALAQKYLAQGWQVITHGREAAPFPDQALGHIVLDLTSEQAGELMLRALGELGVKRLDHLVNNAALAHYGPLAEQSPENIRDLAALNLVAPLSLTWHLFPLLRAAGGQCIFVSSVAAALPTQLYAVYSATKAALDGFVRSFRQELAETGVRANVVHPAGTTTEMHRRAGFPQEKLRKMKFSSAETVAEQIWGKIQHQSNGPLTLGMKAACLACRKFPHLVDRLVARSQTAPWNGGRTAAEPGTALVTGSSSGIGAALMAAKTLPADSQGIDIEGNPALMADLTDFSACTGLEDAMRETTAISLGVWNAGINTTGRFWEIPWARHAALLKLNFLAPLLLSRALLRTHPQATQVFVASLSHHLSYPGASSYAASKDGVAHFARSLRAAGIHALTVFPGPTDTPHAARHSPPSATSADAQKASQRMSPELLAEKILQAAQTRQPTLIPGLGNKVFALLGHWFPAAAQWAMRKVLWEKMRPGETT